MDWDGRESLKVDAYFFNNWKKETIGGFGAIAFQRQCPCQAYVDPDTGIEYVHITLSFHCQPDVHYLGRFYGRHFQVVFAAFED